MSVCPITVVMPGEVAAAVIVASIRFGATAHVVSTPYRASARSRRSSAMPSASRCEEWSEPVMSRCAASGGSARTSGVMSSARARRSSYWSGSVLLGRWKWAWGCRVHSWRSSRASKAGVAAVLEVGGAGRWPPALSHDCRVCLRPRCGSLRPSPAQRGQAGRGQRVRGRSRAGGAPPCAGSSLPTAHGRRILCSAAGYSCASTWSVVERVLVVTQIAGVGLQQGRRDVRPAVSGRIRASTCRAYQLPAGAPCAAGLSDWVCRPSR